MPLRVLLSADETGHSMGYQTIATALRDAGMEVIYGGTQIPREIARTAIQEDVDVIGVSTYCGGELAPSIDLMKAAKTKMIKGNTLFLIGGVFSLNNASKLKELGFHGVFSPSSTREEIISYINAAVDPKGNRTFLGLR